MLQALLRSVAAKWHTGEWSKLAEQRKTPVSRRPQSAAALPRNLKRLREQRGWSIPTLAAESSVSASTIRGIERGRGTFAVPDPLLTTVLKLALALGVGVEALVEDNG